MKTLGLCGAHRWRLENYGDVQASVPLKGFRPQPIEDEDGRGKFVRLPITGNFWTLIDSADLPLVVQYSWFVQKKKNLSYARAEIDGHKISLHDFIFPAPIGLVIDHEDCDGLNNRRFNLRHCTRSQNQANRRKPSVATSSRFKGVVFEASRNRWKACIEVNYKALNLGRFLLEEDAARAYDAAASKYFGEFSKLNFPI